MGPGVPIQVVKSGNKRYLSNILLTLELFFGMYVVCACVHACSHVYIWVYIYVEVDCFPPCTQTWGLPLETRACHLASLAGHLALVSLLLL